jgi:hypothetical protein
VGEATYDWEGHDFISQEIIVKPREIGPSAGEQLKGSVDLEDQTALAFDRRENLLFALLELRNMVIQMLDNWLSVLNRGQRRDVVQGGSLARQGCRRRRCQESRVNGLERHRGDECNQKIDEKPALIVRPGR